MTPKEFYNHHTFSQVEAVCIAAETTLANFQQIVRGKGSVSRHLAEKLADKSGGAMSEMEILYPQRYENPKNENKSGIIR